VVKTFTEVIKMNHNTEFELSPGHVKATYIESEIPEYNGNPLIQALPPIMNSDEATVSLSHYPEYNETICHAPNHLRYHQLQNNLRFFSALDINLDLEERFSRLIRIGYTDRNPFSSNVWKKIETRVSNLKTHSRSQYGETKNYKSTAANGFNILGISGIGKSQTVERILQLYPKVIIHNKYENQNFTHIQLVWLKLDCPFDGSIKGLCFSFFQSIDNSIGTRYYELYASKSRTVDEMIPNMVRVAANHFVGVLVIDEIQRLSKAKSGGSKSMLDFFVQLVNIIGVPMVIIGTFNALPVLTGSLSQMRRGSGQGDFVWDRMKFDEQWDLFFEDLWTYQYLRKPVTQTAKPKLSAVLYDESQGITDLAIKIFIFSQEMAIKNGSEKLTASVIRSAAKAKLNLLRPALKALRDKDKRALAQFDDAYPSYLEELVRSDSRRPEIIGVVSNEPEIRINLTGQSKNETPNQKNELTNIESKSTTAKIKTSKSAPSRDGLLETFQTVKSEENINFYNTLKEKGFVKSGDEFITNPNQELENKE
jgi:AAA domain